MKRFNLILTFAIAAAMIFILPGKSKGQDEDHNTNKNKDKHNREHYDFNFSGVNVKNIGDDTIVIYINKRDHKSYSDVSAWSNWSTCPFGGKIGKFNGHWAGIDFGWNGYVTKNFDMDFPPNEQYLNLKSARSMMVNINPIELNVNIARNKFGFMSGLGFSMHNYYFNNSYTLIGDSAALVAFKTVNDKGTNVGMKVNKLFVSYMTLPLLFEFQTNPGHRISSFHVTVGVIGGLRLQTFQKQRLYQYKENFFLVDDNGNKVATFYTDKALIRNPGQYHLNPFKLDASLRIGWSFLNLFATYSVTPMFQKNQGPAVYPWSVGITLLGW
jgi:hypothetical protein